MTHDALVRFAAEKMDITATKNDGWAGGWLRKEGSQTDWTRVFGTEEAALAYNLDLTSPGLMMKGLEAICRERDVDVVINRDALSLNDFATDEFRIAYRRDADSLGELFWTAWAELEGGKG